MIGPGVSDTINDIESKVDVIDGNVDEIEVLSNTIDGKIDVIDGNVDQIETLSNTIDGKIDVVDGNVDDIETLLGTKTSIVGVPYVPHVDPMMAFVRTSYYHVHGASFIYPDKAVPVTLTSAIASWAETGTVAEVIPANTIVKDFDLHWCSLSDISAVLDGVIDIFAGPDEALVKIGSVDVVRTANFARENAVPVQIPQQVANTRISCRFTDSTTSARTVRVKFYGHVYGTSLT